MNPSRSRDASRSLRRSKQPNNPYPIEDDDELESDDETHLTPNLKKPALRGQSGSKPNFQPNNSSTPTSSNTPPQDPEELINNDECESCGAGGDLLCCDGCVAAFHFLCLDPPISPNDLPEGKWYCPKCTFERRPPVTEGISELDLFLRHCKSFNPSTFSLPSSFRRGSEPTSTRLKDPTTMKSVDLVKNPEAAISRYDPDHIGDYSSKQKIKPCGTCGGTNDLGLMIACSYCRKQHHRYCITPMPMGDEPFKCQDHDLRHPKPKMIDFPKVPARYQMQQGLPRAALLRRPGASHLENGSWNLSTGLRNSELPVFSTSFTHAAHTRSFIPILDHHSSSGSTTTGSGTKDSETGFGGEGSYSIGGSNKHFVVRQRRHPVSSENDQSDINRGLQSDIAYSLPPTISAPQLTPKKAKYPLRSQNQQPVPLKGSSRSDSVELPFSNPELLLSSKTDNSKIFKREIYNSRPVFESPLIKLFGLTNLIHRQSADLTQFITSAQSNKDVEVARNAAIATLDLICDKNSDVFADSPIFPIIRQSINQSTRAANGLREIAPLLESIDTPLYSQLYPSNGSNSENSANPSINTCFSELLKLSGSKTTTNSTIALPAPSNLSTFLAWQRFEQLVFISSMKKFDLFGSKGQQSEPIDVDSISNNSSSIIIAPNSQRNIFAVPSIPPRTASAIAASFPSTASATIPNTSVFTIVPSSLTSLMSTGGNNLDQMTPGRAVSSDPNPKKRSRTPSETPDIAPPPAKRPSSHESQVRYYSNGMTSLSSDGTQTPSLGTKVNISSPSSESMQGLMQSSESPSPSSLQKETVESQTPSRSNQKSTSSTTPASTDVIDLDKSPTQSQLKSLQSLATNLPSRTQQLEKAPKTTYVIVPSDNYTPPNSSTPNKNDNSTPQKRHEGTVTIVGATSDSTSSTQAAIAPSSNTANIDIVVPQTILPSIPASSLQAKLIMDDVPSEPPIDLIFRYPIKDAILHKESLNREMPSISPKLLQMFISLKAVAFLSGWSKLEARYPFYIPIIKVTTTIGRQDINHVDISLSSLTSSTKISKLQASITFNQTDKSFTFTNIGRNSQKVGTEYVPKDSTVTLKDKTLIGIDNLKLWFNII